MNDLTDEDRAKLLELLNKANELGRQLVAQDKVGYGLNPFTAIETITLALNIEAETDG